MAASAIPATTASTHVAVDETWLRILTYVHYAGHELCLDILHRQEGAPVDGGQLYNLLLTKKVEFDKLLKKNVIKQNQYDLILPSIGITDTGKFDITLFTFVIFVLYGKKYKKVIEDLRNWRNGEFHRGNTKYTNAQFQIKWKNLTTMFVNHGLKACFTDLKTCALDAQSVYRYAYLEALSLALNEEHERRFDENEDRIDQNECLLDEYKEGVSANKEDISANKEVIIETREDVWENKQKIDETEQEISLVNQKVEELNADVQNLKQNDSESPQTIRYMIYENVDNFFGREDTLEEIHKKFVSPTKKRYKAVVITGLGGVGKTQIAARYVSLHDTSFDASIWLDGSDIIESLRLLLQSLKIDSPKSKTLTILVRWLCQKLYKRRCLFIFDDVSDHTQILQVVKCMDLKEKPCILITSQYRNWMTKRIHHISLDVFNEQEGGNFLRQELHEESNESIVQLSEILQCFPLAMQQAVCYMKVNEMKIKEYLQFFEANNENLLDFNIEDYGIAEYDKTLLTVWKIALERLQEKTLAFQIFGMIAYMDHRFINKETFLYHNEINEVELNKVIQLLSNYSLVLSSSQNIRVHSLVQMIVKFHHRLQKSEDYMKPLRKMLFSIASNVDEYDTDEKNLWFRHVKKLFYEKDEITRYWAIRETALHQLAVNLGYTSFAAEILQLKYSIFKEAYQSDLSKFDDLIIFIMGLLEYFINFRREKDCIELILETEKLYKNELEIVNILTSTWKTLVVKFQINFNIIFQKDLKSYSSLCKERFAWENDHLKCVWYRLAIHNYIQLGRYDESMLLSTELYLISRHLTSDLQRYNNIKFVADTFCAMNKFQKALQLLESLDEVTLISNDHEMNYSIMFVKAKINAGIGQYDLAMKQLKILHSHYLNVDNILLLIETEFKMIYIYLRTNEFSCCEKMIENHDFQYGLTDIEFYSLVITKLFLNKYEQVVNMLKQDRYQNDSIRFMVQLYMTLDIEFTKKRSTGSFEEANIVLSYLIALRRDLMELFNNEKEDFDVSIEGFL